MKEKKNIDRIFQEKFKDFETEPREKVWDNIASRLDKEDKKRTVIIPLWFKIGGVAAVLAIVLASLLFTNNQQTFKGEPEVVFENPENSTNEIDSTKNPSDEGNISNDAENPLAKGEKDIDSDNDGMNSNSNHKSSSNSAVTANQNIQTSANKKDEIINSSRRSNTEKAVANKTKKQHVQHEIQKKADNVNTSEGSNENTAIAQAKIIRNDSLKNESLGKEENALAQVEDEKKNEEEEDILGEINSRKMRLSTFAAPVFYKNIGTGNELSNQLSDNGTSSEVTLSYGVKIAYEISDRFKIRTGISKIDINQNIQDISYSPTAMSAGFENISTVEDNVEIRDNSPAPESGLPSFGMDSDNSLSTSVFTPGEINQQFGYIEIPLEIEYVLIDNKFGLNIIGGGSSLFLDNNRVQLISGETKTDLGEATNINNTSFSTNIGIGMDYKLTDKFSINVEPIFKYQINTFDKVDNVQPVNFGVYSGISYRF